MKLWLIGDDDVLDMLAELSRHLDYFQVSRLDDLPDEPFSLEDHVLVAMNDDTQAMALLARVLSRGTVGYAAAVTPHPGESPGARAIIAAAGLAHALRERV